MFFDKYSVGATETRGNNRVNERAKSRNWDTSGKSNNNVLRARAMMGRHFRFARLPEAPLPTKLFPLTETTSGNRL